MLALGGPADDVEETRFSAETLAEGCASGMRWAAARMQGHRPHQVCGRRDVHNVSKTHVWKRTEQFDNSIVSVDSVLNDTSPYSDRPSRVWL